MTMLVGCIDVHELEIKDRYDVVNTPFIIFDSDDLKVIEKILKRASNDKFEFKFRKIIN